MSEPHCFSKMSNTYLTLIILLLLHHKVSSNITLNVYEENLDRHQYTLYKNLRVTWIEAYVSCQADGAELLYIDTKSEFEFLRQFINNSGLENVQSQIFWTSGSDIYNENNFVWMSNGKSVANGMWAPGNPSNSGKGEHCVTVHGDPRYGFLLNDDTCSKQKYFICKSVYNSQMILQPENACTNKEPKEKEMMNSKAEMLKMNLDNENYYSGDILAVLIIIAIAMVILTAIVVKEEMKKTLKAWQRKTTSKCRLEEKDNFYEQSI